ncbi:MAG: hypothetical protein J5790_02575 [Bacteroidaceae bacterium]|nr:hypothetical protein [Bacteroidaceae bacterium]
MIIDSEIKEVTTQEDWGESTERFVVMPKGLPGKHGAVVLMLSNLKYFLEMFMSSDDERYLRPYEILAKLEERILEDISSDQMEAEYLIGYKRDQMTDGDVIFEFSHFEVNAEAEPDENYRSLYIYFEYTGSAS